MKKVIATAVLVALPMSVNAIGPAPIVKEQEVATVDTVIGAAAGTGLMAGVASWALPAALAHSSGGAILYSGAGYVAGTMGLAAGTVAALPFIAAGAAAVGTGAVVYKYYGEEIDSIYVTYIGDDQ
jgi:hypothetical protein